MAALRSLSGRLVVLDQVILVVLNLGRRALQLLLMGHELVEDTDSHGRIGRRVSLQGEVGGLDAPAHVRRDLRDSAPSDQKPGRRRSAGIIEMKLLAQAEPITPHGDRPAKHVRVPIGLTGKHPPKTVAVQDLAALHGAHE